MPDDILTRHGEIELRKLGIHVPHWIEKDLNLLELDSILKGGCASGAYMPAVTYRSAALTMGEYGDDVFRYIEASTGDALEAMPAKPIHWSAICCAFLSWAVEQWARDVEPQVVRVLKQREVQAEAEEES